MLKEIKSAQAPAAVGPYSQAIRAGDFVFVSGQLPLDSVSGTIHSADPSVQARQCLTNLKAIAEEAGIELSATVKTTVLLTDISSFEAVNSVYREFFCAPFPARACYEVSALPKGAMVEIEAILFAS
ncbi:RidA family protein [Rhizobium hainanense]|uniref:2-iminobutanoate/2-iminopropanoate deaminase n=1 Tax=Rhizobium hainanense TaxID=52131 RepID=A0A1C3WCP6_9HYPH|nr:RidA family protein [Rhizobium hainanense]SCB37608.1 2-iminobutanoate/2-iminopropanoate deaminase [Rhizobium hainanense]